MFRTFIVIPVVAAMIASTTLAFAAVISGDARSCAEAANEPRQLHVRMAAASSVEETVLAYARREVETIWQRYQIEIVWSRDTDEPSAAKPDLQVDVVPTLPTHRAEAIAWLLFSNGRPLPLARVSMPAAIRLLADTKSWFDGRPLQVATPGMQDMALGRIIGRALAHEIGHFLLASRQHARNGLMRAMIDGEQFVRPSLDLFRLEAQDVRTLRAAQIAHCELAQTVAAVAP